MAPAETPAIARRLRRDIPFDSICFTVNLLTSLAVADRLRNSKLINKRAGMNGVALIIFLKSLEMQG